MNTRLTPAFAGGIAFPVLRRLNWLSPITVADAQKIQSLASRIERHAPHTILQNEGDAGGRLRFVASGWACRQRILPDGRRQIFSLVVPGDAIGAGPVCGALASAQTVALTRLQAFDATSLLDELEAPEAPLAKALERASAIDEATLLDHVVRLGRQTAFERLAHLLLELQSRLAVAGQGDARRFPMPLTQEVLADVLGLSIVHVNRTLQQLRREKLLEVASGHVTLLEPERLADIADYRPLKQGRA